MRAHTIALLALLTGCGTPGAATTTAHGDPDAEDRIVVGGSSTVFPLSEAVAERFHERSRVPITVNGAGTGAGFRAFCSGESSVQGASRPITHAEEAQCATTGVELVEIPVAYDGIVIVVHQANYWASDMTLAELRRVFGREASGRVTRWSQIRPEWPDRELHVYAPGRDSGTFDYFTDAALGTPGEMRSDYDASEDDNYIARRVMRDPGAIGFFGYAYYAMNRAMLRAVAVDDGDDGNGTGAVMPSASTIADGTYQPLARPLFVYLNRAHLMARPELGQLAELYLSEAPTLVPESGMVLLRPRAYQLALARLDARTAGSRFSGASVHRGLTIEEALAP